MNPIARRLTSHSEPASNSDFTGIWGYIYRVACRCRRSKPFLIGCHSVCARIHMRTRVTSTFSSFFGLRWGNGSARVRCSGVVRDSSTTFTSAANIRTYVSPMYSVYITHYYRRNGWFRNNPSTLKQQQHLIRIRACAGE